MRGTIKDKILEKLILSKGEHVSGERLAAELSVSRAAIWKHIKELKGDGLFCFYCKVFIFACKLIIMKHCTKEVSIESDTVALFDNFFCLRALS